MRSPALLAIYSRYALEAFHAENVRFLEDCADFMDRASAEISFSTLTSLASQMSDMYGEVCLYRVSAFLLPTLSDSI